MNVISRTIDKWLRREAFIISPVSILVNPYFIIRRGLFEGITEIAPDIKGEILDFGCGSKPGFVNNDVRFLHAA